MTNELEKQFFDTFGIEPKPLFSTRNGYTKDHYIYPQITDRILLELICIDNQENVYKCRPSANNVEELKTYILEEFIHLKEVGLLKRAHQVRTLFEESKNG
jgi:hypothetical protein